MGPLSLDGTMEMTLAFRLSESVKVQYPQVNGLLCLAIVRQAPHVGRENMDLLSREFLTLGRHLIGFTAIDHGNNGVLSVSMQPSFIGQIGGTHSLVALAVHTVAGRA